MLNQATISDILASDAADAALASALAIAAAEG
jgi:hypothetical protein